MVQHPRRSVSAHYQHQQASMGSSRPLPVRVEEKQSAAPRYAQSRPPYRDPQVHARRC
ncbi:MAG: hypothetical protein HC929_16935 [Leptolyngbyaceae cyanobacterium SM2_5_2]|nr:hypothetical protein [Leptolyngbyaceae cyanobacterium SM2_5_2]